MKITVTDKDGRQTTLDGVNPTDTVAHIQTRMTLMLPALPGAADGRIFMFGGERLEGRQTLKEAGIEDGNSIAYLRKFHYGSS